MPTNVKRVQDSHTVAANVARVLRDPKSSKAAKSVAAAALRTVSSNEPARKRTTAAAAKVLKDPDASKVEKHLAAIAIVQLPRFKPDKLAPELIRDVVLERRKKK